MFSCSYSSIHFFADKLASLYARNGSYFCPDHENAKKKLQNIQ